MIYQAEFYIDNFYKDSQYLMWDYNYRKICKNKNYQLQNIGNDRLYVFSNCVDGKEIRYLRIENGEHNLHWGNPELFTQIWNFLKLY